MSISQIYRQFDIDSHRVFRASMALRPGPVLGVAHLVHGLISTSVSVRHPELTSSSEKLTELGFVPCTTFNVGMPVTNSPELRKVLQIAEQVAHRQCNRNKNLICPRCLTVAVLEQSNSVSNDHVAQSFHDLGLLSPPERVSQPRRVPKRETDDKTFVQSVVNSWISIQNLANRQDRGAT